MIFRCTIWVFEQDITLLCAGRGGCGVFLYCSMVWTALRKCQVHVSGAHEIVLLCNSQVPGIFNNAEFHACYKAMPVITLHYCTRRRIVETALWNLRKIRSYRNVYHQGPNFDHMSSFFPCEIDDAIEDINLGYGAQAPKIVKNS